MKSSFILLMAAVAGICAPSAQAQTATGDAARGKLVFARCGGCHQVNSTASGPTLTGVVGRAAGARGDFKYSRALKGSAANWTAANLDAFLAGPGKFAPGTTMFVSVPGKQDRADVIAYLQTLR